MQKDLQEKILVKDKWIRALLMAMFVMIKAAISFLINLIAVFQFISDLFFSRPNIRLMAFSSILNVYLLQIANFLTFNSDVRPFPFTNWPENK